MKTIKTPVVILLLLLTHFSFSQPLGYYNGTEGLAGENLKKALHDIIKGHVDFSYNQSRYIINYTDADTANPENVILFYLQESRDADLYGTGGDNINREHVWAKSHGNFADIRPMDSDAHNLRPADASVNEDRSNKDFDNVQPNGTQHPEATGCWYTSSAWEPGPATKGQVARILFYMATRYEGGDPEIDLELIDAYSSYSLPQHGKLSTLIEWNNQYPPSNFERRRNERLFQIQQNRNPFVDNPDFANLIWNTKQPALINISELKMTPEKPVPGETVAISLKINSETAPDSVLFFWGNSFDSEQNRQNLILNSEVYSNEISFVNVLPGETTFFLVKAFAGNDSSLTRGSYIFPENISQEQITPVQTVQGTGLESPMIGQQVTVTGRVTGNFDNTLYIRDNSTGRGGICIFNSLKTGNVGDSVVVRGKVAEYSTLTELTEIDYFYNFGNNKTVDPIEISTSQINEDYEGMLVKIEGVTFNEGGTTIQDENSTYLFSDGSGQGVLFSSWNSRLVGEKLPGGKVTVTGILSQYQGTYQLLARDISDFGVKTAAPLLPAEENQIVLYPNPAGAQLFLSSSKEIKSIAVYSASGQKMTSESGQISQIDVSAFAPGLYIITIETHGGDGLVSKKFSKR